MSNKRDQLLAAGETLFVKHGMRRVSVEDICREAGVSRPTFYRYYDNKASLARAIADSWIEEILRRADEIIATDLPFPEKMRQILEMKQDIAARPGPEFRSDLIPLEIDLSHAVKVVMQFFIDSQERGDLRSDVRLELLMAAFDALNNLHYEPRVLAAYESTEAIATDVFKLFYYGALSAEHREAGLPDSDQVATEFR